MQQLVTVYTISLISIRVNWFDAQYAEDFPNLSQKFMFDGMLDFKTHFIV